MGGPGPARRREIREQLLARDGSACHYCRRELVAGDRTIEHVWPASRGRCDWLWNLVWACRPCNEAWGDVLVKCSCASCSRARAAGRLLEACSAGLRHAAESARSPSRPTRGPNVRIV